MAMNDRNSVKGTLGELSVAKLFVEQGCAVNFLTFMDVGMDLHVHMPADLKVPDPQEDSWHMSGRAAHVQVKSTARGKLPSIQVSTAKAWTLGAQTGSPTLLVGVIVGSKGGKAEFRFFNPLVVDYLAESAAAGGRSEFEVLISKGEIVEPEELFDKVAYWVTNGPYMLSHAIPRPWPTERERIWDAALDMIETLTLMFERRFHDPEVVLQELTFAHTADYIAGAFLEGAGIDGSVLDDRDAGAYDYRRVAMHLRVHDAINGAISRKHGWSDWVEHLALVANVSDESKALQWLADICTAYGRVVRGKLTMSSS